MSRTGDAGRVLNERIVAPTIPNITAPDETDVAIAADLVWATGVGNPPKRVRAAFNGPPLANLGIVGAWVSDVATGVVTVRCSAIGGNVATAAQSLALYEEA